MIHTDAVIELTENTFEAEVLHASTPVLVAYIGPGAEGSPYVENTLRQVAEENLGKVKCALMHVSPFPAAAFAYHPGRVPAFVLHKDGEVLQKIVGPASPQVLRILLMKYV